jgi:hypothetical protein
MTDPLIVRRKLNKMIEYLGQLVVENATDIYRYQQPSDSKFRS